MTTKQALFVFFVFHAGCISSTSDCEKKGNLKIGEGGQGGSSNGGEGGQTAKDCGFEPQCDPAASPVLNKTICDDDIPKTLDRCVPVPSPTDAHCGGICINVGAQCDSLDPIAVHKMICDDDNECTEERCFENACFHAAIAKGPCTNGQCVDGVCVPN